MSSSEVVAEVVARLQKQLGAEALRMGGEITALEVVPTGCSTLDHALGVGGLPRGRVTELYGEPSSGKSTLALHVIGHLQRQGGVAAFIDAEQAMASNYAESVGVDFDSLIFSQPSSAEEALKLVEALVEENVDLIVLDTVASLVPQAVLKGEIGDIHVAQLARLMSGTLGRLASKVRNSRSVVLLLNQTRSTIATFGPRSTTPGGVALKFYSSVRIELKRSSLLKAGDQRVGNRVVATIVKNKVGPPYAEATFDIIWGYGVDDIASTLDAAVEVGFVPVRGSFYEVEGTKIQGRANSLLHLRGDPACLEGLRNRLHALWELGPYLSLAEHALASKIVTRESGGLFTYGDVTWETLAELALALSSQEELLAKIRGAIGVPYTEPIGSN